MYQSLCLILLAGKRSEANGTVGHPSKEEYPILNSLVEEFEGRGVRERQENGGVNSFLMSDLGVPLPLHISLSRPLSFPTEEKDEFSESVEKALRSSGIGP